MAKARGDAKFQTGGSMFVTPGKGTYSLFDFSITGYTPNTVAVAKGNYISFIQPSSMKLDQSRQYYYRNGTWYKLSDSQPADDFPIPAGTGFLCCFNNASTLNYSGEVVQSKENFQIETDGAKFFFVSNPYATAFKFMQMTISGYTPNTVAVAKGNYISFFQKGTMKLDQDRQYYYRNSTWYNLKTGAALTVDDDFDINPGDGFLCCFNNSSTILTLPSFEIK